MGGEVLRTGGEHLRHTEHNSLQGWINVSLKISTNIYLPFPGLRYKVLLLVLLLLVLLVV